MAYRLNCFGDFGRRAEANGVPEVQSGERPLGFYSSGAAAGRASCDRVDAPAPDVRSSADLEQEADEFAGAYSLEGSR